jgi:hypothetical protein
MTLRASSIACKVQCSLGPGAKANMVSFTILEYQNRPNQKYGKNETINKHEVAMRIVVLALISLMAVSLQASPLAISPDQLESYKTAVSIPVSQSSYDCKNISGDITASDIQVAVDGSTEGSIDSDGGQPLITFVYSFDSSKLIVQFMTSHDYQIVSEIKLELFDQQQVNKGDLQSPLIEFAEISAGILSCRLKKVIPHSRPIFE